MEFLCCKYITENHLLQVSFQRSKRGDALKQLLECVSEDAARRIADKEMQAIAGKTCDDALFALAEAYHTFVREH